MHEGTVRYERHGPAAFVTFDRPGARNAMTWRMYDELLDICGRLDADEGVRIAVLRGAGGEAFVAGTDIRQFTALTCADDGVAYEQRIDEVVGRLEAVAVPTVAVVEGYAVGGGLCLAAACDLRVCTPQGSFGLPLARTVGNCLSMANYARLVALLGPARVKTLMFTAEPMGAEAAVAAGFVTETVDAERLDDRVAELTAQLATHAPLTLRATKEAIRRLTGTGLPSGDDLIRGCYGSDDFAEGVAAFLDKRTAEWQGR